MCTKTIVKKSCSAHFRDIFQNIEDMDNENYDLSKVSAESIKEKISKESESTLEEALK